jgi:hypothetical protein
VGFGTIFTHNPEHVVEKDGETMVAYVDSFLQVEVRYYDYINAIVRGNQRKIYEDYGNGGYDPFERDVMPEARRSIYYDDDGNVIEQSES